MLLNMNAHYLSGFGNEFETEALPNALPRGRNNPRRCEYGLYAEQLSGTAFTAPSSKNKRSWLYRIRPSVKHWTAPDEIDVPNWRSAPEASLTVPTQYRWDPISLDGMDANWISGMHTMTLCGDLSLQTGMATHVYAFGQSMMTDYFCNADGELLVIPQTGKLRFITELGALVVEPQEIAVIPRGVVYKVEIIEGPCRGFVCENYGQLFTLPERGPIGANGMANARDFKAPIASFHDSEEESHVTYKWSGKFFRSKLDHCPLDVVAWHGNYYPYKYDLRDYSPIGSISFDHPDPSIFTVLTSPSELDGTANVDFVVFKERWLVGENTFRPPWYHRNAMSEFMGNIHGVYDAKPSGFGPGAMSLHNMFVPHGPDSAAFEKGASESDDPVLLKDTMSFMLETRFVQQVTTYALNDAPLQKDYPKCWDAVDKKFDGSAGVK